ncbi:MAG: zinc-ribbon domain-containing protein [Nitrospirae bacterium]|nr:zinc-ribbon domain-containing protein [Nitrospirota bacterium]
MIIKCPKCSERIEVDDGALSTGEAKVRCSHCYAMFAVKKGAKKTPAPKEHPKETPAAIHDEQRLEQKAADININIILVAMDGDAASKIINELLVEHGYEVLHASDGRTALSLIQEKRPAVAILDVGLPQIFGFEISEIIKNSEKLKDTMVILIASIYDRMRYKREPQSLFGADDYIEKHHIRDSLINKIKRLLKANFPEQAPEEKQKAAEEEYKAPVPAEGGYEEKRAEEKIDFKKDDVAAFRSDEISLPSFPEAAVAEQKPVQKEEAARIEEKSERLSPEHEKAKRFARIIISDVALYNQKAVEDGIRNNKFYEILKAEIEEGRKLYEERVPPEIAATTNYFNETIEEFIRNKRKSLNL